MNERPELFEVIYSIEKKMSNRYIQYITFVSQEVRLYKSPKERERYDNQANLFAIISTIEQLERAYRNDFITPNE